MLKRVKVAEIWPKMADVKMANDLVKMAKNDLKPKATENGQNSEVEISNLKNGKLS